MTTKTARYLTRFEDADVSRQQLLALQKHPLKGQPTIAEKVLEKHQSKRLKKRLRGKGGRIGKGRRGVSEAIKGRPKVEEDLEVMRDKLRQEKAETTRKERESYIQQQRDHNEGLRRDRELDIADRTQQAILQAAQFRTGAADVISQREVQQRIADRQAQAQLEDRRQQLATAQIAAGHIQSAQRRGVENRRIDADIRRFDAEMEDRRQQRVADTLRHTRDLAGVQERNQREDERRAREQAERFELAARELAERGAGRQREQENERFRIESQREVDAERSERDRQREETLQQLLTALQRQGEPEFFHTGGSGGGGGGSGGGSGLPELQQAVEDVGERSLERQRTGTPPPTSPLSAPRSQPQLEPHRHHRTGVPYGTPPRGGGGGETPIRQQSPRGRLSPRWPQTGPGSLEEQTLRQQERQDSPVERQGFQSPQSRRRWTRDPTEPYQEQEATPGALRETPTQERIHNVGGSEEDRPEGLDRTGRGPVDDVSTNAPLGQDDT